MNEPSLWIKIVYWLRNRPLLAPKQSVFCSATMSPAVCVTYVPQAPALQADRPAHMDAACSTSCYKYLHVPKRSKNFTLNVTQTLRGRGYRNARTPPVVVFDTGPFARPKTMEKRLLHALNDS